MTSRSYIPLNSTVDDEPTQTQQQSPRISKRTAIGAAVSFVVVAALVVGAVLPQHDNKSNLSSSSQYNGGSPSSSVTSSKSDALHERLNALEYMEKKRQEEFPQKKKSLRSSSMATQGGQLDPLLTKENVVTNVADLAVMAVAGQEEDSGSMDDQATEFSGEDTENGSSTTPMIKNHLDPLFANKNLVVTEHRSAADDDDVRHVVVDDNNETDETKDDENLDEHLDALAYMDQKREEERPKKTSLRSSSAITKEQLDPLFAKEDLTSAAEYVNVMDSANQDEEEVEDDSADKSPVGEKLEEHMEALAYAEHKRQGEHPKKASLRSSSVVTKGQLDPLFAKEELLEPESMTLEDSELEDEEEVVDSPAVESTDEPVEESEDEEPAEATLDKHMDALAYMDKKRQEEHPKMTSVRASSMVTKSQLDPLFAKEELETPGATVSSLETHVDALAYMDKKRQEEHPKKTSVRSSSAITKGQLDPILAKEELETGTSGDHVDALAYMDKKRQEERPKKASVRASSAITKDQLDPILAKEELETGSNSGNHVDALSYMDKKRQDERPKKASVRASSKVTKDQLDPILAKEEFVAFDLDAEDVAVNVHPEASTGATTERRQAQEVESSTDESLSNTNNNSSGDEEGSGSSDSPVEGVVTEELLLSHTWTQADFKVVDFTTEEYEPVDLNRHEGE